MRRKAGATTSIGTSNWTSPDSDTLVPLPAVQRLTGIRPLWAVEGGRIDILGSDFPIGQPQLPEVRIGDLPARVVYASSSTISALVPSGLGGGPTTVRVADIPGETAFVEVGSVLTTGLHQVDSPVFDREGNLYVTFSGTRGEQVPVSIFRVNREGVRAPYGGSIVNPTSMVFDEAGVLYVSSRLEGSVYRIPPDGSAEVFASDLGVACGLALARDGGFYVGDRSGTIFRLERNGTASAVATLPPSVAAYHLAVGPDDALYVTGPTLGPYDHVYRVDIRNGNIDRVYSKFGRPQGLAFDAQGTLYVVEALAGWSGLYRLQPDGTAELVVAAPALVGVAIDPLGGLVVSSNETAYRLQVNLRPLDVTIRPDTPGAAA
jgi:sugar lactone lactonase YvrE